MKKSIRLLLLFSILLIPSISCLANHATSFFNVKNYGAIGDGKNIDSKAINAAIEAASLSGGGTVFIPAGNYSCGSIHLKSNITLLIDQGATIIAAPVNAENGYDQEEESISVKYQDLGHSHWKNSLIWGYDIQNASIVGAGWINGKNLYKDWVPGSKQDANKAVSLYRCRNVIMRDISIIHGGWFAILATGVDNLTIDNLKIDTNRDALDIDCCKNVRISNLFINSPYDDGICLKSTFALGYARPTENVTITNCQLSGYDEGTLLDGTYKRSNNPEYGYHPTGRIKFGTESNGGFKNITISNCVFDYCRGLALETVDGGLLEDVTIANITMRDIVNDPIFLRLGARMRGPEGVPIGKLRRIKISGIIVYNADPSYACTIAGLPGHPIEDIQLSNIRIYYKGGGTKEQAAREIPENENKYPEPGMFGIPPVYGLFVRHANDIKISDVEFNFLEPDYRPGLIFNDVNSVDMRNVTVQRMENANAIILKNVMNFNILQSKDIEDQKLDSVKEKTLN
ncbi:MAG: glycosyl hydrolase family 28-related protein [Ignavibacteriaceae bacterium]|jgi:polygalacturonase